MSARIGELAAARVARLGRDTRGCSIEPGLTDTEFARVEREYGFEFADDHRAFLAAGLPISDPPRPGQTWRKPWPDWRNGDPDALRDQLTWPVEGILFDVEKNAFWYDAWGDRPSDPATALATARDHLARVPTMVPVYAHRYLPGGRGTHGHPILSIWQTDIIYYGTDLPDYITHEFTGADMTGTPIAAVPFWRDLL